MRTTIDGAGRVVIPKVLRERLGLHGAGEVEIEEHDGVVEVRTATRPVVVDRSAGRPVLKAAGSAPTLTDEQTRELLEQTRR
jgi:AbrB family looped-hinge helix DNA binding protein